MPSKRAGELRITIEIASRKCVISHSGIDLDGKCPGMAEWAEIWTRLSKGR